MTQISINIEKTNIDSIIKFSSNEVLVEGRFQFNDVSESKNSPLAKKLFEFPFAKRILFMANFIAIEINSNFNWEDEQEKAKNQIEKFLNDGGKLIIDNVSAQKISPIEVYSEATPNPEVLKFVTNRKIVNSDFEFKTNESAKNSHLALELFKFPFVKEIYFSENYISITKSNEIEWSEIILEIKNFIIQFITSGKNIIDSTSSNNTSANTDDLDEVSKQIIEILEKHVKPAVAQDGGNIAFRSYDKDSKIVNVILQGACSGCPSSTITLKNGIESLLKKLIPGEIEEVVAVNY